MKLRLITFAISIGALVAPCHAQFAAALASPFPAGAGPSSVAAADFNNDGFQDLAITDFNAGTVTVLLGNAMGGFTPLVQTPMPPLTVGKEPVSVAVFYTCGPSNSSCAYPIPVCLTAMPCASLAIANEGSNNLTVLLGNGGGGRGLAFTNAPGSPYLVGTTPVSVAAGNFGGTAGLAVANFGSENVSLMIENASTGSFMTCSGTFTAGRNPSSVAVGDFNGDGIPDIAVVNKSDSTASVFMLNTPSSTRSSGGCGYTLASTGTFPIMILTPPTPPLAYPASVVTADFNMDGKLDLAIANEGINSITILLGDGTGNFGPTLYSAPISPIAVGTEPFSLVVGYFNDDLFPDLAVVNLGDNTVTILEGSGTGTFAQANGGSTYPVGIEPESIAVGDFNGDGRPDLAVSNRNSNTVSVLLNGNTAPSTVSAASFEAPVAPGSLIAIFGSNLGTTAMAPMTATNLPFLLGEASVILTDSTGSQTELGLMFTSPTQINALVPPTVNAGQPFRPVRPRPAFLTVYTTPSSGSQTMQTGIVPLQPLAPALFSANGTGEGAAMGSFEGLMLYQCPNTMTSCVANPIDVSQGGMLTLDGTGIIVNQASGAEATNGTGSVSVMFGGQSFGPCVINPTATEFAALNAPACTVATAPPAGGNYGVNVVTVLLPALILPNGLVPISVTAGGLTSNVVTIYVQSQ